MTYSFTELGGPDPGAAPESIAELLALPEAQRQLMVWLLRQRVAPFQAIVEAMGEPDLVVRSQLASLIQQGLVTVVGEDSYRAYSPQRQQQQVAQNLEPTLSSIAPLSIILSSPGRDVVTPGGRVEIGITVSNRGSRSAIIDVLIEDMAPALRQWCQETRGSLALAPDQSGEVVFAFEVPVEAIPGTFNYLIVVDAPAHYPEFPPARYPQQIQVLTPIQDRVQTADPTFALLPTSSAQAPLAVPPGGILQFQVQIFNRSEQVDRFRLTCLDLPADWVKFDYPQNTEGLGLIVVADSLGLNPGDRGSVSLTLSPPLDALAGIYTPTLQLLSENSPHLTLLDLIYLQVQPVYLLQPELLTLVNRAHRQPAQFQLLLANRGNSDRWVDLAVQGLDGADLCTYTLETDSLALAPRQTRQVGLTIWPRSRWQRPWFGGGRLLTFQVTVADREELPLVGNRFQGYFTWAARPWWQLLLVLLLAIGALATLVWIIWWLFFRPPAVAGVVDFFVEEDRYAAAQGDRVRVGWQLRHPHRLQTVRLTGLTPDGAILSGPLEYDLTGEDLPRGLAPFCTQTRRLLTCRQVYTDARLPGDYIFELTLIPKTGEGEFPVARTPMVTIDPIPLPTVVELVSGQSQYLEAIPPGLPTDEAPEAEDAPAVPPPEQPAPGAAEAAPPIPPITEAGIRLSWVVSTPENLQDLLLSARGEDGSVLGERRYSFRDDTTGEFALPEELTPFCTLEIRLVCQEVATGLGAVGDYTFELTPIAFSEPETAIEPKTTQVIKVIPRPVQLLSLLINGQPALPKYVVPVTPGQPPIELVLSWVIAGGSTATATLDPAPGTVPLRGSASLPLSPEPGSQTLTLTLSNGTGEPTRHSITIETYDPDPVDAAAIAAAAAAAAAAAGGNDTAPGPGGAAPPSGPPALDQPIPSDPGRLSPTETPPQFD